MLSVNVSVLPYVPLRSVSVAVMFWRNVSVDARLVCGAANVISCVGAAAPPTAPPAPARALRAPSRRPAAGCVSATVPLTSRPMPVVAGS